MRKQVSYYHLRPFDVLQTDALKTPVGFLCFLIYPIGIRLTAEFASSIDLFEWAQFRNTPRKVPAII